MNAAPTKGSYSDLEHAFQHFNRCLFDSKLPNCLITLQRHKGAYGYFSDNRFASIDDRVIADEIAMNPATFDNRKPIEILSTLVHEMCHLWQHAYGKPSKRSYHNREWAEVMLEVGLIPQAVDGEVGQRTGEKISHRIEPDGRFERAANQYFATGGTLGIYMDRVGDPEVRKRKAASKTRYTCPGCLINCWAKPGLNLICGDCEEPLEVAEPE